MILGNFWEELQKIVCRDYRRFFCISLLDVDPKNAQLMKNQNTKACPALNLLGLSQVQFYRSQLKPLLQYMQCASVVAYFELVT